MINHLNFNQVVNMPDYNEEPNKIAYTITEVRKATGLSSVAIHKLCNSGHLTRRKVGKRTFILAEDLIAFFRSRDSEKWGVAIHPAKGKRA